jgi:glycosyltransferase involved in cell wall biosynthesis
VGRLADVQYVCEPRPGLDFARNRALEEAQTAYVAFLDDDVVVDGAWLAGLEEALAEQPDAAIVTGLVLPLELETEAQILFELRGGFRRGFRKLRYEDADHPGSPLYPCGAGIFGAGCNMVVDRQALQSLGGFDEALDTGPPLPGGGDLDIFYRVIRSGRPLAYEPRMLVFHEHRREYDALRRQYRSWGAGFMSFVAKSYGWDVEERRSLRRVVRWWYTDQLRELASSLRSPSGTRPRLVGAELVGGIAGIAGTYQRSLRRARRIRERWATSNRCP